MTNAPNFQHAEAVRMSQALPYDELTALYTKRTELEVLSLLRDIEITPDSRDPSKYYMDATLNFDEAPNLGLPKDVEQWQRKITRVVWASPVLNKLLSREGFTHPDIANGGKAICGSFDAKKGMTPDAVKAWFDQQCQNATKTLSDARSPK